MAALRICRRYGFTDDILSWLHSLISISSPWGVVNLYGIRGGHGDWITVASVLAFDAAFSTDELSVKLKLYKHDINWSFSYKRNLKFAIWILHFFMIYLCFCKGEEEDEVELEDVTVYLSAIGSCPLAILNISSVIAPEKLLVFPLESSYEVFGQ